MAAGRGGGGEALIGQLIITYLLTPWFYGPLSAVPSLITNAHSPLSTAFCLHLLTFIPLCISSSTFSGHLSHGLPFLLLPSGLLSNIFLALLPWSIFTISPIHSSLSFFNICYYVCVCVCVLNSCRFLFSIFIALPLVRVSFLIFSSPTYSIFPYPSRPLPSSYSQTLQLHYFI